MTLFSLNCVFVEFVEFFTSSSAGSLSVHWGWKMGQVNSQMTPLSKGTGPRKKLVYGAAHLDVWLGWSSLLSLSLVSGWPVDCLKFVESLPRWSGLSLQMDPTAEFLLTITCSVWIISVCAHHPPANSRAIQRDARILISCLSGLVANHGQGGRSV